MQSKNGQMAEWLKATDCKSVHSRVRRFEPYSAHERVLKAQALGTKALCKSKGKIQNSKHNFLNFELNFFHLRISCGDLSGSSSIGRAIAFQAIGREFDPRLPL